MSKITNEGVRTSLRPLPVILLLDVSSSMKGPKIESLNFAVKEMLKSFSKVESTNMNIHVAIITFGNQVSLHTPLKPVTEVEFTNLNAYGNTPLGQALTLCKELINDPKQLPNNAKRPIILLVSDGEPNGNWKEPFEDFINNGITSKCDRHSIAIGAEADYNVLERFLDGNEKHVLQAADADGIEQLFRTFTQATVTFAEGKSPSIVAALQEEIEDEYDDDDDIF